MGKDTTLDFHQRNLWSLINKHLCSNFMHVAVDQSTGQMETMMILIKLNIPWVHFDF